MIVTVCSPIGMEIRGLIGWLLVGLWSCYALAQDRSIANPLSFDRDVRPILTENCLSCHGFDQHAREADLRLDTRDGALNSGSGQAVIPGNPAASLLIQRIESTDEQSLMPPPATGKRLTAKQQQLLRRWIQEGADYQQHWAFVPPQQNAVPYSHQGQSPIDAFIQQRLLAAGLQASPSAGPETLLRRLSLDLIGLPPTIDELDQFLSDYQHDSQAAYQQAVERLLASPHYGERWARWWLDQARYADSNGYSIDAPRQIWLYRDWVVNALNDDMPFDQFTIEQLAGDLLPAASESQTIATGFHRNTQINQEGGIDREQFRIESVFDRVATTGTVWLGITLGCAQCHNHKYDPISQREYYQFFAFFNNQDEPELKLQLPVAEASDMKKPSNTDVGNSSQLPTADKPTQTATTLVMKEREQPRETRLLIQGDFTRPAEPVTPGVPTVLHSLESTGESIPNRLHLARWIVDRRNPLTARVIVNRLWLQYFGRGLVDTENDFGLQSSVPSHPELLDWLAVEFMEQGWSLKQLQRWIVMSLTYQQSSQQRSDLNDIDPYNSLLARQQRLRLDAEIVRDTELAVSGLLVHKLGGPPVYPPIPEGVMSQGQVKRDWPVSSGPDRYRRGLYTFIFRATPPPALNVFDAPEGLSSCTRRIRSNTPLQALTLMNDATHFEFAQALQVIIDNQGVAEAFRRCTSRMPTDDELAILQGLDNLNAARVLLNLDETISRE